MIKAFEKLTAAEKTFLYKAPVIFSADVLSEFKNIQKAQKTDAVKLAHVKTFTEHPLLIPYYRGVEKSFSKDLETYLGQLIPFTKAGCDSIKSDKAKVYAIIGKLDSEYGALLQKSLEGYALHVKRAAHSVFQDIIFPVAFSKL